MLLTMACLTYLNKPEEINPSKPLSTFPTQIGEWKGERGFFDKKIYEFLGVHDSFLGNYSDPNERTVQLYIGFYRSQREGEIIHSPKQCMPGAGWNITRTSLEEVLVPASNPEKIKAIKLILQKGHLKQVVLYWFQSRGRFITSEYRQKIYLVIDSVLRHRTDGSFVRLVAPIRNESEEATLAYLKSFAGNLIPILKQYIPS